MEIQQRIKKQLEERASERRIADIRIGLGYTAVMLQDGSTGLAGTPLRHVRHGCTVFDRMLPLTGANACDLLELLESKDPLETAAGLATANALSNIGRPGIDTGDVLDFVNLDETDHVGMVGNFAPLAGGIKNSGAGLTIFEQIESPEKGMLPAAKIPEVLPECSVCLLTATSIINHTFDSIIEFASDCRSVVLLGASTPLVPEVFAHTPVTCLSGVLVTRPGEILHIVSCGGGMRRFGGVISKVNMAVQN
ncbi:MAG: Rossmann-like domain-containing protein [Thermodesulfobacteriota bacterium]